MTIFHLVRHGSTPLAGGRILAGRTPGHRLDDAGRSDAERVATALARRPIGRVVSGPLERATETAAPLAEKLGLPVRIDPALDEVDYGAWTGADWSTLEADPDWIAWNGCRGSAAIPAGETIGAVADRAIGSLRRLADEIGGDGEAALFTHADVIRAVLASVLGLAPDLSLRLAVDPGSRSLVRYARGVMPLVLAVNVPP